MPGWFYIANRNFLRRLEAQAESMERREFQTWLRSQSRAAIERSEFQEWLRTQKLTSATERNARIDRAAWFAAMYPGSKNPFLKSDSRGFSLSRPPESGEATKQGLPSSSIAGLDEQRKVSKSEAPRRLNVVAQRMQALRKEPSADLRRYNPAPNPQRVALAQGVRRAKRREVLFAKGRIGKRRV